MTEHDLMLEHLGITDADFYSYSLSEQRRLRADYYIIDVCRILRDKGKRISKKLLQAEQQAYLRGRQ